MKRQISGWKEWRSWLALLGITLPVCPLLAALCADLGTHIWPTVVSWVHHGPAYDTGLSPDVFWIAVCLRAGALFTWSWTSGFALGFVSRRTMWVSGVVFFVSYILLANITRQLSMRLCWSEGVAWLPLSINFFLVLLPAYWGMQRGSNSPSRFPRAILLSLWTIAVSGLAIWSQSWDQAAEDNWSRGGSALTLLQAAQRANLQKTGMLSLFATAALAAPIFYVLAIRMFYTKQAFKESQSSHLSPG
jgi:hypothetical protein